MKYTVALFFALIPCLLFAQSYTLRQAFPSLPGFTRPVDLQYVPDGSNRLVVVQQLGLAYMFNNTPNVASRKVFIDLQDIVSQSGGELGFLGLAFHPNFTQNGYIYVNYTRGSGNGSDSAKSFIARFQVSGEAKDTVLLSSQKILLTFTQPYANHNGGWIAFGPDGYLYTSFGDGGSGGDPQNRAQNLNQLFGKILRIDVDQGDPYSIPSGNRFKPGEGRQEIYAYGLRNPWRCSFDRQTNKLWAGDVGQGAWEEVDTIINGGNYGWRVKEGYACFGTSGPCDSTGFQSPLGVYPHPGKGPTFTGVSITGGYVYRGNEVPSLVGKYIFADYNGKVFSLTYEGLSLAIMDSLTNLGQAITSFGLDQNNELYALSFVNGKIYEFTPEEGGVGQVPKQSLASINPNPASTTISITPNWAGTAEMTITDVVGKTMRHQLLDGATSHLINIESLPTGAYTVQITAQNATATTMLLIQR